MRFVSIVFLLLFTHNSLAGEWLEALNAIRGTHALPPLREAEELDRLAEDWANELVRRGRLEHRPGLDAFLSTGGWTVLLENIFASRP
ncbi:MAG TPA: CAP domain-containing protein, partial [Methylococcus sp.]|nr:CAP domain-containing protein [Methylococcus sp.]